MRESFSVNDGTRFVHVFLCILDSTTTARPSLTCRTVKRSFEFGSCGDPSPSLHDGLRFRGALQAAAPRANARSTPKTGTVGTVAAECVDGPRRVDDGTQCDPRPDGGRHIAAHCRRTTEGRRIPSLTVARDLSSREDVRHGRSEFDASRTSATHRPPPHLALIRSRVERRVLNSAHRARRAS
jgi:hypothetical protein